MGLEQIRSLADELNSMIPEFGDTIYTCSENAINYIKEWEPNFICFTESIKSNDPIQIDRKETEPTEEQLKEIYDLAIDLYIDKSVTLLNSYLNYLKQEKDINIEVVQNYVTQFSSLMQLITLPNFDTKMIESLKKYKCITQDNIFYLLDDMLNKTINWVLADGASFNGKVFDIYKHENVEGFILHNSLDEWASSYYSVLVEYEGRPDSAEKKPFPSVTYDLILEFNKSKEDVPTEIQTIIKAISKVNSDIINFLTYKDFEERFNLIETKKSALEIVREATYIKIGKFTKQDIKELCPSLSISSIEGALRKLIVLGEINRVGQGKNICYYRVK